MSRARVWPKRVKKSTFVQSLLEPMAVKSVQHVREKSNIVGKRRGFRGCDRSTEPRANDGGKKSSGTEVQRLKAGGNRGGRER